MKLRSLVVDDNVVYRESLVATLAFVDEVQIVACCENAFEARDLLLSQHIDLVFLDIEMPGLSGVDLIKSLTVRPEFIFITSHPGFALESYELEAVDFIVKPVSLPRIMKAISKASLLINLRMQLGMQEKLNASSDHFFVKENSGYTKLNNSDVLYIESMGNFINIYLADGSKKIALVSLKNAEQQLPPNDFIRISKTHIINRKKVTSIRADSISIGKLSFATGKTYNAKLMEELLENKVVNRFVN